MTNIYFEDEIICPYCSYRYSNSYINFQNAFGQDELCDKCGNIFSWERHEEVSFSTYKKEETND